MSAGEYPKTENVWVRDEETHKLVEDSFRLPQFEQIAYWHVTEKIDGTNIRVILDWAYDEEMDLWRPVVDVRGRTDKASLPKNFVQEAFDVEEPYELTEDLLRALAAITDQNILDLTLDPVMMVLYGEGYGAGIQSGGGYAPSKRFRSFDVRTYKGIVEHGSWGPGLWRTWDDVVQVSLSLGVKTAPVLHDEAPFAFVKSVVKGGLGSTVAREDGGDILTPAEGVIARTNPYLYDYRGNRVMFKLKGKDLA